MAEAVTRVHVGRVVFLADRWLVQTLDSHARNVALLAGAWDGSLAFRGPVPDLSRTHDLLVEAARIHDMAKPVRFRLQYESRSQGPGQWKYSFSGHRFDAFHPIDYVQTLARLHHEYSVAGITQNMARLRLSESHSALAQHLPLDLYALEMCDQIEATISCAVLGSHDPEERVFMDFQFRSRTGADYELDPYPFHPRPLCFVVDYAELCLPAELQRAVETAASEGARRAGVREAQAWLLAQLQVTPLQHQEVRLWPWTR